MYIYTVDFKNTLTHARLHKINHLLAHALSGRFFKIRAKSSTYKNTKRNNETPLFYKTSMRVFLARLKWIFGFFLNTFNHLQSKFTFLIKCENAHAHD